MFSPVIIASYALSVVKAAAVVVWNDVKVADGSVLLTTVAWKRYVVGHGVSPFKW